MNKRSRRATLTPQEVSLAVSTLMPNIIRGVQLDFFLKRRVTQTQFLVLIAVRAYGRCTMSVLARSLHVSMPTVTGIVDRLVRAGHVRRTRDAADRRHVLLELTANGQRFIQEFQGIIRHRWEEVLTSLEPAELKAFYHVVTKLRQQLQSSPQGI